MERQATDWEKIHVNQMVDKQLISRIYKEHLTFKNQETGKRFNRLFSKKIYECITNNHVKRQLGEGGQTEKVYITRVHLSETPRKGSSAGAESCWGWRGGERG